MRHQPSESLGETNDATSRAIPFVPDYFVCNKNSHLCVLLTLTYYDFIHYTRTQKLRFRLPNSFWDSHQHRERLFYSPPQGRSFIKVDMKRRVAMVMNPKNNYFMGEFFYDEMFVHVSLRPVPDAFSTFHTWPSSTPPKNAAFYTQTGPALIHRGGGEGSTTAGAVGCPCIRWYLPHHDLYRLTHGSCIPLTRFVNTL